MPGWGRSPDSSQPLKGSPMAKARPVCLLWGWLLPEAAHGCCVCLHHVAKPCVPMPCPQHPACGGSITDPPGLWHGWGWSCFALTSGQLFPEPL